MSEESNKDILKLNPENPPSPRTGPIEIKKRNSLLNRKTTNYLSQLLLDFNNSEENKQLEEMLTDLEFFHKEYNEYKKQNKISSEDDNSNNTVKMAIFNSLEKNLIEISYLSNKEIRTNRIESLYLWYKKRKKINEDLKRINIKSYKEKDEINDLDLLEEAKNHQNESNNIDSKKIIFKKLNHRNEDLINKKMINDYQHKALSQSLIEKKMFEQRNSIKTIDNDIPKPTQTSILAKTYSILHSQDYSRGDFSTFYSNKNGTNIATLRKTHKSRSELNFIDQVRGGESEENFFPKYNKESGLYFPPLNRETKFSYSYNRPPYNYTSIVVEKKIKDNKLKLVAEKRGQEEINKHLEKFGIERAKYKENMNNKYELKSIINMYVNSHDLNSPLLEKYKIKEKNIQKNKSANNIMTNNLYHTLNKNVGKTALSQDEENKNKSGKNLKKIGKEKTTEEFEDYLIENKIEPVSSKIIEQENDNNDQKKRKKCIKSVTQKIKPNKKLFKSMDDNKIIINEIKNLDNNTKNLVEQNTKINKIKMKIKMPKEKMQTYMMKLIQKKPEQSASDAVSKLISNNNLFKEKKLFQNLCNANLNNKIQEKSSRENISLFSDSKEDSESTYHNFCLSMYDLGNLKKINNNNSNMNKFSKINNMNTINLNDAKNKFNKLHKTFNLYKDDFLNLRRTMSDWKKSDYFHLVNEIKKNNKKGIREKDRDKDDRENMAKTNSFGFKNIRFRKQNSLFSAMINPIEGFKYSQYFLPRSGSMLLSRNEEQKKKKKK